MNTIDFKDEVLNSWGSGVWEELERGRGELVSKKLNNKNQLQNSKTTAWESTCLASGQL